MPLRLEGGRIYFSSHISRYTALLTVTTLVAMDLFRSGLKGFSIGGFKLDENTANLVANFASGGGLGNAFDQISRTISPNPRKAPPRPPPIGSFKVVN